MNTDIHIKNKLKFRNELLEGNLTSYKKLESISSYLSLFQKYYFKYDVNTLDEFIRFLFQYKKELDKINQDFLLLLMKKDLLRLTIPTKHIMDDLIVLIDKCQMDFNSDYLNAVMTVISAFDEYEKDSINHDFYKYYLEYKRVHDEYKNSNNPRYNEMSYNTYMMSKFILAYAYYYEEDLSFISTFFNNYINNYDIIMDHFGLNRLNNIRGDIDFFKHTDYLVTYILSFDKQKRKIIL